MLDAEATLCYLGDMLCSRGGCDSAIAARCSVALGKFRKLSPVLNSRHLSPNVRGRLCTACVHSPMLHGSDTWGLNISDLERFHHNDRSMIHRVCGNKDQDGTPSASLLQKFGIKDIMSALRSGPLIWHVQWAMSCIISVTQFPLPDPRTRGRLRKTWSECVKTDASLCGLSGLGPQDSDAWKNTIRRSLVLPTPLYGTQRVP